MKEEYFDVYTIDGKYLGKNLSLSVMKKIQEYIINPCGYGLLIIKTRF